MTATSTGRPRLRTIAIAAMAVALGACGSTVNRPTQVAVGVDGAVTSAGGGAGTPRGTAAPTGAAATGGTVPGTGAASGGGTGAPSAGGTGAVADPAAVTPDAGPVRTGPVEIGFMVSRASNAAAFGGSLPELVDQVDIYNALVRSQNANGGLHGREIVPVFEETDSASNNFDADIAAACATFTEDHDVEAVVGRIADLFDSLESCLDRQQIPHIAASPEGRDNQFLAQYPYLFNTASLSLEQRTRLKVDYAVGAGILTPADTIGVVFAACAPTLRSWEQDAMPYMQSQGLNIASVFSTGCPSGANSAIAEVGKIGNLILQFRSAGVDTLYFHAEELAALFVIANAAEAQGWRPRYFVSTLANTAVSGTQIPAAQAANVSGLGWSPASDVQRDQWPAINPAAAACLARLAGEGVVPQTPLDHINAFFMCDTFTLLVEAVDAAGGRVDGPSVAAAIQAMGSSHQSAYTYDGTSTYGPGDPSGVASAYPYAWDAGCSCYRYSGGRVVAP